LLTPADLTDTVKHAVFAAEDASFETNPGFDTKAIARAVWIQVTGGESGGSGLTQQYIKQATEDDSPTLSRKFTEVVKAYKMNNQQSKDEILTAYLNTIYQGRSAFGFKAAAQMYYKKDIKDLTDSEAALIAGLIQNPGRSENVEYATGRWKFVMGQMLDKKWITKEYYDSQTFPAPLPLADTQQNALEGARAHIQAQIEAEMATEAVGWPTDKGLTSGIVVHTTIDPKSQTSAEEAVDEVMKGQPTELRTSMSAIDPSTGAVRAYWAGNDGVGIDYQKGTLQEPGSSFKAFDLVAALQNGKGLGTTYDGTSPRKFGDVTVSNSNNDQRCGKQCTLRRAMELSVNTVFYDMVVNTLGTKTVANAAFQAGIPKQVDMGNGPTSLLVGENGEAPDGNIALGGGGAAVRPFDMTSAYATFAARGVYHEPFFITKIEGPDNNLLYQHKDVSRPAFDADPQKSQDIADNVTEALKVIPKSSRIPCADGRECAGKTGTHELPNNADQNSKAWMVGYTPALSAGVWVGRDQGNEALQDAAGNPIYGSGLPGKIWQKFMDKTLNGTPMDKFPKAKPLGQFEDPKITPSAPPSTITPTSNRDDNGNTGESSTTPTKNPSNNPSTSTTPKCTNPFTCTTTTTTEPTAPIVGGGGAPVNGRNPNGN
jgi:membrane peptidoglycan carboxypeptidase